MSSSLACNFVVEYDSPFATSYNADVMIGIVINSAEITHKARIALDGLVQRSVLAFCGSCKLIQAFGNGNQSVMVVGLSGKHAI